MSFLTEYPELFAILVLILGVVVARLFARWSAAGIDILESRFRRLLPRSGDLTPALSGAIKAVVFYATLGFFLLLAIRVLGVDVLGVWLDAAVLYLPRVVLGVAIIAGGYLISVAVRGIAARMISSEAGKLLPRLVQYLVLMVAIITGLGQMAIDVSFLASLTLLVLGTLLGGLSLAFALGSRDVVANMLARRELDRYQVGDQIRIEGTRGSIVELSRSGVLLETEEGQTYIPASRFASSMVVLVGTGDSSDD